MANSGGKRPVLRADKRTTPSAKAKSKRAPARKSPRKRKAAARSRGPLGWIIGLVRFVARLIWGVTWRATAMVTAVIAVGVFYFYAQLPPVEELVDGRTRGSVTLLDREDRTFAWRGEVFNSITDLGQVSDNLTNAVIATEDKRFYRHIGVSPRGVASAVKINLREGRGPLSGHGGSTLTQQTAKLLCLGVPFDPATGMTEAEYEEDCRRTTKWRKVKEAIYAMAMEARYTKDEILTIYMNRAYLGASARGFEAASQRYFGISAAELQPNQAAMLAGLLVAPTRYAPTNSLKRAQDRAATVVKLMHEQGYLTAAQRDAAWNAPATLSSAAEKRAGGYFADWVMKSGPAFLTRDTTEDVIMQTTLDQKLQTAAEEAMDHIFTTKVSPGSKAEAAIVVMSADGAVRAMVGGRKTKVSGAFNRAAMARRQTGSSFKPFVYAAALDLGFTPNATVVDEPFCMNIPGSGEYCPKNYTRNFRGRITLSEALAHSVNVVAVKVSEEVGRENVQKIATDFGIASNLADGAALALGASESTLIEMTGAYAGILNGGRSVKPYGLRALQLKGDADPLAGQDGGYGERVITEQASQYLVYMMSRVIQDGTGKRAQLGERPAAGKSGTTQAARDAWFIGFTADYVVGVWMGYDDNTPLKGTTGGGLPADIWRETMVRVHKDTPINPLPMLVPQQPKAPVSQRSTASANSQSRQQQAGQPSLQDQRRAERRQRRLERQQRRQEQGDVAERVLQNVLRELLGQ
ncbi:transglycosylase domain-containing protein [Actibacterium sp. 188UL27-1]|uniref:transglycosylase domain-containing protein n=1 Tax=Actibacterium sp. 188UL27-1 TaxID=2786961 RepID=UPI0019567D70|nr:transglycosylase domain-containing protein [Actibacterium sp. 188UL27-1]MBM7069357.1 transglycosylase domain-containing protein [Actibacterium sp. 188UL27-1]